MPALEQQFCQPCEEQEMIRFHDFLFFSRCTKHGDLDIYAKTCKFCDNDKKSGKRINGKFSRRKRLTSLLKPFGEFINDYYLKTLERYAYHRPHFILLGKNETGNDRKTKIKPCSKFFVPCFAQRIAKSGLRDIASNGNFRRHV